MFFAMFGETTNKQFSDKIFSSITKLFDDKIGKDKYEIFQEDNLIVIHEKEQIVIEDEIYVDRTLMAITMAQNYKRHPISWAFENDEFYVANFTSQKVFVIDWSEITGQSLIFSHKDILGDDLAAICKEGKYNFKNVGICIEEVSKNQIWKIYQDEDDFVIDKADLLIE